MHMNDQDRLEAKIAEADAKLDLLEKEIEEIGMPAATNLRKRLEALRIEEAALKRNVEESRQRGEPDSIRLAKIETLLQHIEDEEDSMAEDAHFLHQAAPSSMELAVQAGAQVVDLYRKGMKKVIGDRHPLGESVFVNHTHENLTEMHGLKDEAPAPDNPK